MPIPETTYYQAGSIIVTNARAVLGPTTYAMANITSVSMGEIPANRTPGIVIALIGLTILAFSVSQGFSALGVIIGALFVVGFGAYLAYAVKPQYMVKIGSASGESNALTSSDREQIQQIVNAINEAIIKRG